MDETPHEVLGVTVGDSVLMTESPRKGRENAIQKVIIILGIPHYLYYTIFNRVV